LRHRKRASQSVSPLNESEKEDAVSISEDEDEEEDEDNISEGEAPTPQPKRTTPKMQFVDDGIPELASTDSDWKISVGDNDKDENDDELDSMDLGTVKNTLLTFIIQIRKRAHCRERRKQSRPRKRRLKRGKRRVA
jgi:hypothetical protein